MINTSHVNVVDAMTDEQVFGSVFGAPSWQPWRAFVSALYGLPLDADGLALYRQATGRTAPPTTPAREAFAICGRRSGKSITAALIGVYSATCCTYQLAPGETPVVLIAAVDKRQAGIILDYCRGLLDTSPLLRGEVAQATAETITLRSGVRIEVRSNNFRSIRGVTCAAAIVDELCFLRDEDSAAPDVELYRALRPALSTTRGPFIAISSPWSKRGLMYQQWQKHHGRDGDPVMTWVAASATMNPSLDGGTIAEALNDDPVAARSEWLGLWRDDIVGWVQREALDAVVVKDRRQLPPAPDVGYYHGFVDPSGGASDSFSFAVAHCEERPERGFVAVLDLVHEVRAPFDPEQALDEIVALARTYRLTWLTGDYYGGEWVRSSFRARQLGYAVSKLPKRELFGNLLPLICSKRVELLDHGRLLGQLAALERRASAAGLDLVDHPPGMHDDLANAAAGALVGAFRRGVVPVDAAIGEPVRRGVVRRETVNSDIIRRIHGGGHLGRYFEKIFR